MNKEHILVIGGTKGIGHVAVKMLAAAGHAVSVIARHPPESGRRVSGARYWSADVSDRADLQAALGKIVQNNGKLNHLIFFQRYRGKDNNWDGEIQTTLTGTKQAIDFATVSFDPAGASIVIVSSINAHLITKKLPLGYHLGKAGLNQMVRYYAATLGPRQIRVNSVSPATVLKEESKSFFIGNPGLMRVYKKMVPLGRMGTAEEVVKAVLFLCSDNASFITGQDIVVDGGISLLYQEALVREMLPSPKRPRKKISRPSSKKSKS
ncbi:MAG: SDR family oxidoreductase [Methylacidiphilales bacterium]|nr:SDR family oxidoreductase [Candidatus Methylacidiphilales bacterium]